MSRKIVDRIKVKELYDEGARVVEIAKKLGCTKGTVSKILKEMNLSVTKAAVAAAPIYVEKADRVREYLLSLADKANREIVWIEKEVPPKTDSEYRAWQDQKLKFAAEMRKLITTVVDIGYKFFQQSEVMQILREIDEEIGFESKSCQARIRERLRRRRDIRFPIDLN